MALKNSSSPGGKKQTPMPGPGSAAYKKVVAARRAAAAGKSNIGKNNKKRPKTSCAFSTLKSRQQLVERVKREIWASVLQINEAIINLALCGNYSAAKALFDFAGVYSLPDPDADAVEAATPAMAPTATPANNPVDAFFKSIGIEPPCDEPEPDMAACG